MPGLTLASQDSSPAQAPLSAPHSSDVIQDPLQQQESVPFVPKRKVFEGGPPPEEAPPTAGPAQAAGGKGATDRPGEGGAPPAKDKPLTAGLAQAMEEAGASNRIAGGGPPPAAEAPPTAGPAQAAGEGSPGGALLDKQKRLQRPTRSPKKSAAREVTLGPGQAAGSAMIVTPVDEEENAQDFYSLTQDYLKARDLDPTSDEKSLWGSALFNNPLNQGGYMLSVEPEERARQEGAKRKALVIGNSAYRSVPALGGAKSDASAMAGVYRASHEVTHREDLTAVDMVAAVRDAQKDMTPGGELIIYYAGHGISSGLLGVDTETMAPREAAQLPYGVLSEAVSAAISGGWHATIIADACQAGALSRQVNDDLADTIDQAAAVVTREREGSRDRSLAALAGGGG